MTRNPTDTIEDMIRRIVREELAALADPGTPDAYLSPRAAAALADVAEETIRRWVRSGRLPRHGTGRMVRVSRVALERLLARGPRRRPSVASPEAQADRDFG